MNPKSGAGRRVSRGIASPVEWQLTTGQQLTREEAEFRRDVGFTRALPKNVMTAVFACPSCNWPLVASMFTEHSKRATFMNRFSS